MPSLTLPVHCILFGLIKLPVEKDEKWLACFHSFSKSNYFHHWTLSWQAEYNTLMLRLHARVHAHNQSQVLFASMFMLSIEEHQCVLSGYTLHCWMTAHVLMISRLHTSVLFLCTFSSSWIILLGQLMEAESQREDNATCLSPCLVLHTDKEILYTRLMQALKTYSPFPPNVPPIGY